MNRNYKLHNRSTSEESIVQAVSARDALAKAVGFRAIAISGLDYYSDVWHTRETLTCRDCDATFSANYEDLHSVCTDGVLTCQCGKPITI